jgi:hypothetical protein
VLVLDDDLGFVAMLCLKLTETGFVSVPATVAERALPLLKETEIGRIDLLIVNFAVPGGVDLIEVLRADNERLKIIAINDLRASPPATVPIDGVILKPSGAEPASARTWLEIVEGVLAVDRARTGRPLS